MYTLKLTRDGGQENSPYRVRVVLEGEGNERQNNEEKTESEGSKSMDQ